VTIGRLLCAAAAALRTAGIEEPRREARWLLAHVMGRDDAGLLAARHDEIPEPEAQRFRRLVERRAAREPFAHLVGQAGFWSLSLDVSPAALIPRPDSEALIEAARDACASAPPATILDLGTGGGALLLAALSLFPSAFGVGADASLAALRIASGNARRNGLAERAAFVVGDWAEAIGGSFDLVLCNPPYIERDAIASLAPEVALHEPPCALDGGADGLDSYRRVVAALPHLLSPGGLAVLELGIGQERAVSALAERHGLETAPAKADLQGIPRALPLRAGKSLLGGGGQRR
jgi:release factor glutamine methyltransferase